MEIAVAGCGVLSGSRFRFRHALRQQAPEQDTPEEDRGDADNHDHAVKGHLA
jgi:hypothetical protein